MSARTGATAAPVAFTGCPGRLRRLPGTAVMARAGATLAEALTALTVGCLALAAIAAQLHAGERLAAERARRLERRETLRIAASLLRRELRVARPGADIAGSGHDSLALRLFRGMAVTCAAAAGGAVLVDYAGARHPDPAKDSVLPLLTAGAAPLALRGSFPTAGGCVAEGDLLSWELDVALPPGTPLLLFQHGTYALSRGALRVRHGGEGRQPLTVENLDDRASRLTLRTDAANAVRVDVLLAFKGIPFARRLRIALPNGIPPREAAP